MDSYIKGNYRKSIFKSDNGYVIGLFKVRETNDDDLKEHVNHTITFTGYFHELNEDDTYILYGEFINHPKYGMQFQTSRYERLKPTGEDALVAFFSSDLFPGIGEKVALEIARVLGDDAIDKILEDESCLYLVPNLSENKIKKISSILKKNEESHKVVAKLIDLGFSMKEALAIYNMYKHNTRTIINNNIYQIVYNLSDVPFLKVDKAGKSLDILDNDFRRVKATILYVMKNLIYQNGDSYLSREVIIDKVNSFLKIDYDNYDELFKELEREDYIVICGDDYYLEEIYTALENIVNRIYDLVSKPIVSHKNLNTFLSELEKVCNIKYNDDQRKAIMKAIDNNILIITGGPGTGKTTIIKAITELYMHINKLNYEQFVDRLALLAPTGRASKRMSESTGLPASTIHRFLKWNKDTGEFMINEDNKSHVKLVIVDEVSMIDINLFDSLLKGLTRDVKIILVGDYDQLPSVGPGTLLKDLISSEVIDVVHLNHLYRQGDDSYITSLAYDIKDGNIGNNFLNTYSDYTFLRCLGSHLKNNLINLCRKIIDKGYDYKRLQILAPMYKGENGIDNLNKELQNVFNPPDVSKREIRSGNVIFRENDKILQLVNMPDENVFNGDIGVIRYIKKGSETSSKKDEIYVDFDGNMVKYMPKDFNKIKHGFIISIHKSQGSEFEMVIMPMVHSYRRMLYKKLVYTGVTRAKKKLIIIGEPDAFLYSVQNNHEYIRNSKLTDKIKYKFENVRQNKNVC